MNEKLIVLSPGDRASNLNSLGLRLRYSNSTVLSTSRNCPIPLMGNYMN